MTPLNNYLCDGANHQARAVLMFLQGFNIEDSWSTERKEYLAEIKVARWENCREQGYILSLRSINGKQLNIAFFEHRNSDCIDSIKWEQVSMNSLNFASSQFVNVYKDKYDTSHSSNYGDILDMVKWIKKELTTFWNENLNKYGVTHNLNDTKIIYSETDFIRLVKTICLENGDKYSVETAKQCVYYLDTFCDNFNKVEIL